MSLDGLLDKCSFFEVLRSIILRLVGSINSLVGLGWGEVTAFWKEFCGFCWRKAKSSQKGESCRRYNFKARRKKRAERKRENERQNLIKERQSDLKIKKFDDEKTMMGKKLQYKEMEDSKSNFNSTGIWVV